VGPRQAPLNGLTEIRCVTDPTRVKFSVSAPGNANENARSAAGSRSAHARAEVERILQ
jgi:hypothetical protein